MATVCRVVVDGGAVQVLLVMDSHKQLAKIRMGHPGLKFCSLVAAGLPQFALPWSMSPHSPHSTLFHPSSPSEHRGRGVVSDI